MESLPNVKVISSQREQGKFSLVQSYLDSIDGFLSIIFNSIGYFRFAKQNPDIINYYKKTIFPDESFIVTILVNSKLFNLCNDYKRYMDWTNSRQGHPCILTVKHYSIITNHNIHFARKLNINYDSKILDMLDARILQGS